ncbi:MAG: DUF4398 domain-containing protein [Myxococcales bacterium]
MLAVGCASYPQPTEHLASSMAAVRGAEEAGATSVPKAALHLKLAQEELEQARTMLEHGDNERADAMTIRAYNDAELALALAREEAAERRLATFDELSARDSSLQQGNARAEGAKP